MGIFHLDWMKSFKKCSLSNRLRDDDHVSSAADDNDESNGEYIAVGTYSLFLTSKFHVTESQ